MTNKTKATSTARLAGSFSLMSDEELLSTPPLSPSVCLTLAQLNIHTLADLKNTGAVKAFALLKACGLTVTKSVLWQLAALCLNISPQQLSTSDKQQLQDALKQLPPQRLPPNHHDQQRYMQAALEQARLASEQGEIPIGAVVVHENRIIAVAHNECVHRHFIGAHAEMLALERAGQVLGSYRLSECDVYVTVEPCVMCAGALLQARVKRVMYGIAELKTGAVASQLQLQEHGSLNHHTTFFNDILADECRLLMQNFFEYKR